MYTSVSEVYRIAGLDDTAISEADVTEAIRDAEKEVDRITFTTYHPIESKSVVTSATSTTLTDSTQEWIVNEWENYAVYIYKGTGVGQIREVLSNTATELTTEDWTVTPDNTSKYVITYLNKITDYYDGTNFKHLLVERYPIVQVDELEIDGETVDPDDYYIYKDVGRITLTQGAYTSFFFREPQGVKVTYFWGVLPEIRYGEFDMPREIRDFTGLLAALRILVEQMGGTYNKMSSWTLPNFTGTIGQQYINIEGAARRVASKIDRMHEKVIGRYSFMR